MFVPVIMVESLIYSEPVMISSIVKNNIEKILKLILVYVGCTNYRPLYVLMQKHPNYPSLLSFKYILDKVGVDSLAMSSTIKQLRDELPKPVLVHVTTNVELFLLVEGVDSKYVNVLDADGKSEGMPIATFEQIYTLERCGSAVFLNTNSCFSYFSVRFIRYFVLAFVCFIPPMWATTLYISVLWLIAGVGFV